VVRGGDHEQRPARRHHTRHLLDGRRVERDRHRLDREALHDEVERVVPLGRRIEQVGGPVLDDGAWEARARRRDRRRRDVEGDDIEAALGDELGVGAQSAADDERAAPGAVQILRPLRDERMGFVAVPRHGALAVSGLDVERFEESRRVDVAHGYIACGALTPSRSSARAIVR